MMTAGPNAQCVRPATYEPIAAPAEKHPNAKPTIWIAGAERELEIRDERDEADRADEVVRAAR